MQKKSSGLQEIFNKIKYVWESWSLYSIFFDMILPKIPAKSRSYIKPGIAIFFGLLYGVFVFMPIFFHSVYEDYLQPVFDEIPTDVQGRLSMLLVIVMIIPVLMLIGAVIWRSIRDKNHAEILQKFSEERKTVILKPRGDDKNKWRDTYAGFWAAIHRNFRMQEKDVLLQKLPVGAFEVMRFGPWLTENKRDEFIISMTVQKDMMTSVLTQLQALHNDMVVEFPEDDLIAGLEKEQDAQLMYMDFTPASNGANMLQTETNIDNFRILSTTIKDMSTGVYSAGVQLLTRDALNMYAQLSSTSEDLQYDPATKKRKTLDDIGRAQLKDLEAKKSYSANSITYDVVLRIYVIGKEEAEMKMVMTALSEWVDSLSGRNRFVKIGEGADFETVVERRFPSKHSKLASVSPLEMRSIWHLPDVADSIQMLSRAGFRMISPPQSAIIQAGEKARPIGFYPTTNGVKLEIGSRQYGKNPDIFYHTYIVGPTGVGKSVCMQNLIVSDMNCVHEPTGKPFSVIVLEPHDDLTTDILKRVPDNREGDVILVDPLDRWPIGMNMMETTGKSEDVESDSYSVLSIFAKAMGSSWESAVRMQRMMGNAIQTIMRVLPKRGEIPTVLHLQAFLSNAVYRNYIIDGLGSEDGILMNEWMNFQANSEGQQSSILDPAVTRINKFLNNQILRRVVAQPRNSLNFSKLMDNGTIVLAKMNTKMGDSNRTLVGGLIVSQVFKAAMSRGHLDITHRQPTGFYIDEFQTMVSGTGKEIEAILAEARKMRLGMTMANQFFNQLPSDVQNAVGNNTGTKIVFRCEPQDARLFEPIFQGKLSQQDFIGLQRYMAHLRVMSRENPEVVTVFTFPPPAIPETRKVEANNRSLNADTAKVMGITLSQKREALFSTPEQLLGYVMSWEPQAYDDSNVHADLVNVLAEQKPEIFNGYQNLRKKWGEVQRKILLRDPSYIPEKRARIEQLSRLRVGVPSFEIDSMLGRLNNQIMQIMEERQNAEDGGGDIGIDDDFFNLGGGSSKKTKKKKTEDDDLAGLFDSF